MAATNEGKRARRRRAWAALGSLVVHAMLALWLWRTPRPAPPSAASTIEIELQTEPLSRPAPPSPDLTPAAPAERPAGQPPRPTARGPAAPIAAPPPVAARPSTTPAEPADHERATAAPEGTLHMRSGPIALAPDLATLGRFEREGVITATPAPEVTKPARGPTFSERLAARVRDDTARVNVFEGHAHPVLYDFLRDAQRDLRPAEGHLYADTRSPNTVGRTLRSWARDYLRADPAYLLWERALAARRAAAHGSTLEEAAALREYDKMIEDNAASDQAITCRVCLVVATGRPTRVELAESSGNGEMDRASIEALERAVLRRPLDPDVKPQRACYHFAAAIHRLPPLPLVGCGFDETTHTFGCYYPTMRVLRTSVTLDSVDYDGG